MTDPSPIHRLFGLAWADFFRDTAIEVETEIDLSLNQQFLDLVIIRKAPEPLPRRLPDGFEDLAPHNLVTFKTHHEAMDVWALFELIGHYVNYRKQFSPSMRELLPENDFKMFAVCVRFPSGLDNKAGLKTLLPGVCEVEVLATPIRIIVASQLRREEQNARLLLFSARDELLEYGQEHSKPHSKETSTLIYQLFKAYSEDPDMSDKLKEYVEKSLDEIKAEILKRFPIEERLKGLSPEEEIRAISALSPEARALLARQLRNEDQPKQ